jgi:hypothetical protein
MRGNDFFVGMNKLHKEVILVACQKYANFEHEHQLFIVTMETKIFFFVTWTKFLLKNWVLLEIKNWIFSSKIEKSTFEPNFCSKVEKKVEKKEMTPKISNLKIYLSYWNESLFHVFVSITQIKLDILGVILFVS